MSPLADIGIIERLSYGKYRVRETGFVDACRAVFAADPKLEKTFRQGTLLPFLAAHTAKEGIAPVPRVSGVLWSQWAETAQRLAQKGWVEPVDARRTKLRVLRPEIHMLIEEYRRLLARRGPNASPCVYQSGCEAAWQVRPVPSDWWIRPHELVAASREATGKTAVVYVGARNLDELDQLLLAARAATGAKWDAPWLPSKDTVTSLASRLTLNQVLGQRMADYCSLYGYEELPDVMAELHLGWSDFPGSTSTEPRRQAVPINWQDLYEGAHRTRYGVFPSYLLEFEERRRRGASRSSSRYTSERAAFGDIPASRKGDV